MSLFFSFRNGVYCSNMIGAPCIHSVYVYGVASSLSPKVRADRVFSRWGPICFQKFVVAQPSPPWILWRVKPEESEPGLKIAPQNNKFLNGKSENSKCGLFGIPPIGAPPVLCR